MQINSLNCITFPKLLKFLSTFHSLSLKMSRTFIDFINKTQQIIKQSHQQIVTETRNQSQSSSDRRHRYECDIYIWMNRARARLLNVNWSWHWKFTEVKNKIKLIKSFELRKVIAKANANANEQRGCERGENRERK